MRRVLRLTLAAGLVVIAARCATDRPFDSVAYLRGDFAKKVGRDRAARIAVPFELDRELSGYLAKRLKPSGSEVRRAADIVDFVFGSLDLQYALHPTRDAVGTFRAREGNCLSFVNLFVGIARSQRLNAFYVEVIDAQRWNHAQGLVVSQGHIVAGMNVDGSLRTYDFLPYRSKAYRDFAPIDDLTATAHYYNNLAAEALFDDDLPRATALATNATDIDPRFVKGLNNLGVCLARRGDLDAALAAYDRGLAVAPDDPALLSNSVRIHQQLGQAREADELLARLEALNIQNPFFYVYQGESALARGDLDRALASMIRAFRIDTELPEVHIGLAKVYLAAGELDRARHHIDRALRLDATHPEARRVAVLVGKG